MSQKTQNLSIKTGQTRGDGNLGNASIFCDDATKICSTASLCLPAVRVQRLKSWAGGITSSWSACVSDTRVPGVRPNMCSRSKKTHHEEDGRRSARRVQGRDPGGIIPTPNQVSLEAQYSGFWFFFVGAVSQTLRFRNRHRAFLKSVLGISPGGAGEVHERAQLPPPNSHSDTHQPACMAPPPPPR